MMESLVSLTACVMVWIGWWGLWDGHIFPTARDAGLTEDCSWYESKEEAEGTGGWQQLARQNAICYIAVIIVSIFLMFFNRTM